ncbi:MAG: adenylate/guanylate cyclase domain-containing protein [Acidimicrobiales bacterium]
MASPRLAASVAKTRDRIWQHVELLGCRTIGLATLTIMVNAVPGAALFVYLQFMEPAAPGPSSGAHTREIVLVAFGVFLAVAIPAGLRRTLRSFAPIVEWLESQRPATPAEQRMVLRQPVERALGTFWYWAVAACLFGGLDAALGYTGRRVALIITGVLLAALASCSLTALVIERALRPVAARALAGNPPSRRLGIRVLPRLVLSWAFGSGVPLVALMLAPLGQGNRTLRSFTGPLLFFCVAGLISGFTIIVGAARAVSDPLAAIRRALKRVEAGDLSVEVVVNDGGEVGQLQAGVNRMVEALRRQRQLEDLFGRYVGAEVAAQAMERGVGLGGARCEATVLFVDLIGSTALASSEPPETVVRSLNVYFAAVVGAVGAEGGWVNKFEGDGALCVFGPPGGTKDHAARALRAARAIRASIEKATLRGPRLEAAIGVSSGSVVAGNIGSTDRFEYTVVGDPVNEASRLTELAKATPGRVLAGAAAVRSAGDEAAHWVPAGAVVLRGRSSPTETYRALAGDEVAAGLQAGDEASALQASSMPPSSTS